MLDNRVEVHLDFLLLVLHVVLLSAVDVDADGVDVEEQGWAQEQSELLVEGYR